MDLRGFQRSFLMKRAHHLKPVVMIGKNGPSPEVITAADDALAAHELIKMKFVEHKDMRREMAAQVADRCNADLVQIIGNVAVLYRPKEDPDEREFHLPGEHAAGIAS